MLYRFMLRNLCAALLKDASTLAKNAVYTTLAWPSQPDKLPAIYLAAPQDSASSNGAGPPDFTRTASVHIHALTTAHSASEAQSLIERLNEEIECTLLTSHDLLAAITQVSALHTTTDLNADNRHFIASATLVLELDYIEHLH